MPETPSEMSQPVQEIAPPAPDIVQRTTVVPEVNLFDGTPAKTATAAQAVAELAMAAAVAAESAIAEPAIIEIRLAEIAMPSPAFEIVLPPPAVKTPAAPPADPLAHIMSLTDEERIALFS